MTATPASNCAVDELPPIRWSRRTALDPKHRPQRSGRPASTVRREWARFPQEAHLLDEASKRIRRLLPCEIQRIQGFEPEWFDVPGVTPSNAIRAAGDAVPPPLSRAIMRGLAEVIDPQPRIAVELCAGAGGLASGIASLTDWTIAALVEFSPIACRILRHRKPWPIDAVVTRDVRRFDLSPYRGGLGLLSGGLPCQPWSRAGMQRGTDDPRDLLGMAPELVAASAPAAFVLENVPGLLAPTVQPYLEHLLERLRRPSDDLRYGVLIAVLNAADFGVPQIRRRVFILGARDCASRDLQKVFDRIQSRSCADVSGWANIDAALADDATKFNWMRWPFSGACQ